MTLSDDRHEGYERRVGRWSRIACGMFLERLARPPRGRWLDVGCGTGATTIQILERCDPALVVAVDSSDSVEYARGRISDARALLVSAFAEALPFAAAQFDTVMSGLVLNLLANPDEGVAEMVRVARPGGVVAAYVWDFAGEMQMMNRFWEAAIALDPAAIDKSQGKKFPLCEPDRLRALFERAGLSRIEVESLDAETEFLDFEDLWAPMCVGGGSIVNYVAALSDDGRRALREKLRALLPVRPDGAIHLIARAFSVRGVVGDV